MTLAEAVRQAVDIVELASRHTELRRRSDQELIGLCPLHKEKTPSFTVDSEGGRFYCFGCGTGGDAIELYARLHDLDSRRQFPEVIERLAEELGLDSDTPPGNTYKQARKPQKPKPRGPVAWEPSTPLPPNLLHFSLGRPSRVWEIRDDRNQLFAAHCRFERPTGKAVLWWRSGHWARALKRDGLSTADAPLYGAQYISSFDREAVVALCEGEKAADAVVAAGSQAVGTVTGASGTPRGEVLEVLRGFEVTLWPDADEPGRQHMKRIAELLRGVAAVVRWFEPEGLPKGGDAVDYLERVRA